ncbi:MAG: hypothetical protein IT345_07750 [Trueperaceae bacterium]|nr:hypothetical protein [Trueperaceae bacterium]
MRLLMTQARVELSDDETPVSVEWDAPAGLPSPAPKGAPARRAPRRPLPPRRVVNVIDRWRCAGRWWEARELRRGYYLLELDDGAQLELFREGDAWWVARTTD